MDFELSTEYQELRTSLREFFQKEAPIEVMAKHDREERFPAEIYRKMAELGLCGLAFGSEYGGSDADELAICIIVEEIARAGATIGYAFVPTATFCAKGIARYGNEEQRRKYLPEVAAGRMRFAMGLSEPDAGSDLAHLSTRAVLDGDEFVIRGQKIFTTGADTADYIFTLVRTDPDAPVHRGLSIILIPRDVPEVTVRKLPKLAGQGTHTCEVFLDDVRVPAKNLVGELNGGTKLVFGLLDAERIYVGAQGCGIAQGALDMAVKYARERVQFGKPIIRHQAIGHMLADMATEVEMARLLVWRAAWKMDRGLPASKDASMAKIAGSEVGTRNAMRGMQVLGGYSYMVEYGMERYYRETKLNEIAGGTNQIQRNIIAKHLERDSERGAGVLSSP